MRRRMLSTGILRIEMSIFGSIRSEPAERFGERKGFRVNSGRATTARTPFTAEEASRRPRKVARAKVPSTQPATEITHDLHIRHIASGTSWRRQKPRVVDRQHPRESYRFACATLPKTHSVSIIGSTPHPTNFTNNTALNMPTHQNAKSCRPLPAVSGVSV
jgi:hypothetical protein